MRKLIAILVASAMVCAFAPLVGAAGDDTIEVYLTPGGTVSIDVYNSTGTVGDAATWHPSASIGDSGTNTGDTFYTINNTGSVNVSIDVKGENTADWTIAGSAGHDQFKIGTTSPAVTLTAADQDFLSDLPSVLGSDVETFGLTLDMPTSSSTNTPQQMTITFTATAL